MQRSAYLPKTRSAKPMNPWLGMWTRPRETIQRIVDTNPRHQVYLLVSIYGTLLYLDNASFQSLGDDMPLGRVIATAVVMGTIGGVIGLYLAAFFLGFTGRWIGGQANAEQLRAAYAWSCAPLVWILPIWAIQLVVFRGEVFSTATPIMDAHPWPEWLLLPLVGIQIVIQVWAAIVYLKAIGQVHGFSAWAALGNLCLAFAIAFLAFAIVFIPLMMLAFTIWS